MGLGRGLLARLRDGQNRARDRIGAIGGAALAALIPGSHVDFLEVIKADVFRAVDGLGNRRVDPFLRSGLHADMVQRRQGLRVHEIVGQGGVTLQVAPQPHGIVDHLFLGARAVLLQHLARIGIGKDRLDTRRDIARIKADGAGRRD